MPITEPIQKEFRDKFVKAEHDLMWLAEHGLLDNAAEVLYGLRDFAEKAANDCDTEFGSAPEGSGGEAGERPNPQRWRWYRQIQDSVGLFR